MPTTLAAIDVARVRRDTPACAQLLHFNNAGASLMPDRVLRTVTDHLELEARIGGYEAADREARRLEAVYASLAQLLHCGPDEVAVVESATRAWDMAFYSIPLKAGDRVLTAHAEYVSNYLGLLQMARRTGCSVEVVPNDAHGQVDVEALRRMLDERVKLVCITHVASSNGLVNPVEAVGQVLRGTDAVYLVDACQSAGQLPLDVARIGCDLLSATGRKFLRGPRGTGFLYVRRSVLERLEPPFVDWHAANWTAVDRYEWRPDARRFESFEHSAANKLGLGAAVDLALELGLDAIADRIAVLTGRLRGALRDMPGVVLRDGGERQSGIVTFTVDGAVPFELRQRLLERHINTSVARQEMARLDLAERGIPQALRASVHYYNTEEEVDRFVRAIAEVR